MNAFRTLVLVLPLLPAAAVATPRCEQPRGPADRLACAKAAEGSDALRRFVTRTQGIYQLYYWDYVPVRTTAQAEPSPALAPTTVAARD